MDKFIFRVIKCENTEITLLISDKPNLGQVDLLNQRRYLLENGGILKSGCDGRIQYSIGLV